MESTLIAVTLIALALAVKMSMFASRLLKGDTQDSDARVETLAALAAEDLEIEEPERNDPRPVERPIRHALNLRDEPARQDQDPDWRLDISAPAADLSWSSAAPSAEADVMFRTTSQPIAPGRRWLAVGLVAVAATIAIGVVYSGYSGVAGRISQSVAPRVASAAAAPAPNAAPLELLSLRHEAGADHSFTITGLVQNPAGGTPLRHVLAVVYLFDRDGNYFVTGRAELDVADLRPGDQSPFVVHVPNADRVGRYRVGFRTDESGVVVHVDKRGQPVGGTTSNAVAAPHPSGIE